MGRLFVFDCDGVMAHYDVPRRLEGLARLAGRRLAEVRAAIWDSGFEDQADRGAYDISGYLVAFSQRLGAPLSRDQWVANRRSAMTLWPPALELVRRCQDRGRCVLLTDNGPLFKAALPQLLPPLQGLFGRENLFFSCDLGHLKSEPASFVALLQRLGYTPAQTAFLDDHPANVETARRLGIAATLAKGFEPTLTFGV